MSSGPAAFLETGRALDARWEKSGRSQADFPQLATSMLLEADLPSRVDIGSLAEEMLAPNFDITQRSSLNFGQPAITMFAGDGFYIEVLFWFDATTSVHQHGFSGAFQVLHGSSIHVHYDFHQEHVLGEGVFLGAVVPKAVEWLRKGAVRTILPDRGLIHSLFHLDQPSVSIVARVNKADAGEHQLSYMPPHVAYLPTNGGSPAARSALWDAAVTEASRWDVEAGMRLLSQLLAVADAADAMRLLASQTDTTWFGADPGYARRLVQGCPAFPPSSHDQLIASLTETWRRWQIASGRSLLSDAEGRFFIGALRNTRTRDEMLQLLRQRCPAEEVGTFITRNLEAMAKTGWIDIGSDASAVLSRLAAGQSSKDVGAELGIDHAEIDDLATALESTILAPLVVRSVQRRGDTA